MAPIDDKVEALKQRVGTLASQVEGIPETLVEIKNDLKWHSRIGWTIVGVFASAFVWMLTFYIPDKINDKLSEINNKLPSGFSERFGKMEADIQNLQDRLNRLTPASLNDLIPSPNAAMPPTSIANQLQRASKVIDVAFRTRLPATPGSLSPLIRRASDLGKRYAKNPQILTSAEGVDVRLSGYEIASDHILKGVQPITDNAQMPLKNPGGLWVSDLTISCLYATAHVFSRKDCRDLPAHLARDRKVCASLVFWRCGDRLFQPAVVLIPHFLFDSSL